jgi:hypothetical protein
MVARSDSRLRQQYLSGVGILRECQGARLSRVWQDPVTTAYGDMATHSRERAEAEVLPTGSLAMDRRGPYLPATLKQTPSAGGGVRECGTGASTVVCPEGGQVFLGPGVRAQGEPGAPTGAGRGLGSPSQTERAAPGTGGGARRCAALSVGAEVGGRQPPGGGRGRAALRATGGGGGFQG